MKKVYIYRVLLAAVVLICSVVFSLTVYAAADDAADNGQTAAEQQTENEGYDTLSSSKSDSRDPFKIVVYSIGISAVVTGFVVWRIYSGYKYNGQTEPYLYTKNAPLTLTRTDDRLINREVNKRKIERNNN